MPFAGGGASLYHQWGKLLPDAIEVLPLQLPGREARRSERPFVHMRDLVSAICNAVGPLLTMPVSFYGHSMGATVVFEVAREMRRRGWPQPKHLFVAARRSPEFRDVHVDLADPETLKWMLRASSRYQELVNCSRNFASENELLELFMPPLRADLELLQNYRFHEEPPLHTAIHVLMGENDVLRHEELAPWANHSSGDFSLDRFPGGHFFLIDSQSALLQWIADVLCRNDPLD